MPTEQQQAYIETIRAFPAVLDAVLATIAEAELDERITPDEWCTRQIVHHLADSHSRALLILKTVLFEDKPLIPAWRPDVFAEMADYRLPVDLSVQILHSIHPRIVALLESLDETQWQRIGIHARRGDMTLEDWAALYAWHGGNHSDQIKKTLGRTT